MINNCDISLQHITICFFHQQFKNSFPYKETQNKGLALRSFIKRFKCMRFMTQIES